MTSIRWQAGYWRLWSVSALSNLGDGIREAALPLLAAALTGDPVLVAGVTVAQRVPWLAFGLMAGALVDRADRKRMLIAVNAVRAVLVGSLVLAVVNDQVTVAMLYALVFVVGVGEALSDTAAQVAVPALVPTSELERANGRMAVAQVAGNELIGPPLGGTLFAMAMVLPFVADSGLLAMALGCTRVRSAAGQRGRGRAGRARCSCSG